MSQIAVTIVKADDGQVLMQGHQAVQDIPERFDMQSTIQVGENSYMIVSAEPADRASCATAGQLTLKVQPIKWVNPEDMLYSIPTISDALAPLVNVDCEGKQILLLPEDDWRQVEFVAQALEPEVDAEFAMIAEIFAQMTAEGVFRSIHGRKFEQPLRGTSINFAQLQPSNEEATSSSEGHIDGLSYVGANIGNKIETIIEDGFVQKLKGGLVVYGQSPQGKVSVLSIADARPSDLLQAASAAAELCATHNLMMVDWCRGLKLSQAADVSQYFQALAAQ